MANSDSSALTVERAEKERAAFEAWARDSGNGGDLKYYAPRDQYLNLYTHGMWQAWQAASAIKKAAQA